MSKTPPPSTNTNINNNNNVNNNVDTTPSSSTSTPFKLRKIPPIPIRRSLNPETPDSFCSDHLNSDGEADVEEYFLDRFVKEATPVSSSASSSDDEGPSKFLLASSLGLNHIRTKSVSNNAPLRISPSPLKPFPLGNNNNNNHNNNNNARVDKGNEANTKVKWSIPPLTKNVTSIEQGKKLTSNQAKLLRYSSPLYPTLESHHESFLKDFHSPRFQTLLRLTSGRKKKTADIKSFSHELNSKGVRPFPIWKSRAVGHMEEFMVAIKAKFERLKEEVDSDLCIFAGDLVGILEKTSDTHPEWKETLEDLLVIAQQCAKMSPDGFWLHCEGIVQNLDDRRQELPMGFLKQAHTRLLFILTRCSRLVQFQKENCYEEESILGLHQLSDLGVYPEKVLEASQQDLYGPLFDGKPQGEKERKKSHAQGQDNLISNLDQVHQHVEVNTAKSVDSTGSSYKMSSWRKLPSPAEKNRKDIDSLDTPTNDTPTKDKSDPQQSKEKTSAGSHDNPETPEVPPSSGRKVSWAFLGEHQNITYDDSMICRICEDEIPVVHVEEHSLICTIADRCDLKGMTVNDRLNRVAETLEKILDSWTPKGTPKSCDTPYVSVEGRGLSTSGTQEEMDELSPKENRMPCQNSEDIHDVTSDCENAILMEDLNVLPNISGETQPNVVSSDVYSKTSSGGSLTPRSPLLTPRTSQIELLLSGRKTITELENYQQVSKILEITQSVELVNGNEYSALECMLDRLEELKYAIQDRKVDALVVETFGRRIEKLLQEKYVHLCAQIDDEKLDSSNHGADEDSSVEDDTIRSLRASPMSSYSKDRTSIEDFEIIKPISRGAFGRVFLARKRKTGDLFAIKVLKKADMIRKNAVESILAERNILISVRNPFVVRFFYSFTCRENLYLVMEYLNGGDLYSLLRNLGCLEEEMARTYIAEVVLALELLHSLNVVHRDLKPDNLLIGQDGHLKLTDFGLSKVGLINSTEDLAGPSFSGSDLLDDEEPKNQHLSKEQRQKHSVVGTPDYLAPEILLGMGHGATADWWSVGIILFELLVGIPPFNAETPQQIFDNIINRDIPWPKVPEELSHEAYDLIDKLLTENPVQRLGASGATEVKRHPFFAEVNWDTLARKKAMFIPSAEPHDTSYFMSRYIWNPEEENVIGGSDFDDLTDTCSSSSFTTQDDDGDECGNLADFNAPALAVKYSFSNFSFKNLSQLASINYDLVVKSAKEALDGTKPPSVP